MANWWQLAERVGHTGESLRLDRIVCPHCRAVGGFQVVFHTEKEKPSSTKK